MVNGSHQGWKRKMWWIKLRSAVNLHVSPRLKFVQVASALQTLACGFSPRRRFVLSCFGSTNLGHSASFGSSDGLFYLGVWLWFFFSPLILSFHRPCAPRQSRWSLSHYFGRDPSHSMHLANEFGLTALASVSFPSSAIWNLLPPFV